MSQGDPGAHRTGSPVPQFPHPPPAACPGVAAALGLRQAPGIRLLPGSSWPPRGWEGWIPPPAAPALMGTMGQGRGAQPTPSQLLAVTALGTLGPAAGTLQGPGWVSLPLDSQAEVTPPCAPPLPLRPGSPLTLLQALEVLRVTKTLGKGQEGARSLFQPLQPRSDAEAISGLATPSIKLG